MKSFPFPPAGDPRHLSINRAFLSLLSRAEKQRLDAATTHEHFNEIAARRALKARPRREKSRC